jgi:lipoprotein signal peptidase
MLKRSTGIKTALAAGSVAAIDLLAKAAVNHWIGYHRVPGLFSASRVHLVPGLALTDGHNYGILGGGVPALPFYLTILSVVFITSWVVWTTMRFSAVSWVWLCSGLILGGTIGNAGEELFGGFVTDFIRISVLHVIRFNTNFADIALVIGLIMMVKLIMMAKLYLSEDELDAIGVHARSAVSPQLDEKRTSTRSSSA